MKKRVISCLLVTALCSTLLLSGCGNSGSAPAADTGSSDTPAAADTADDGDEADAAGEEQADAGSV